MRERNAAPLKKRAVHVIKAAGGRTYEAQGIRASQQAFIDPRDRAQQKRLNATQIVRPYRTARQSTQRETPPFE
jgi:hypothetical protein